jgi:hypothetical protein
MGLSDSDLNRDADWDESINGVSRNVNYDRLNFRSILDSLQAMHFRCRADWHWKAHLLAADLMNGIRLVNRTHGPILSEGLSDNDPAAWFHSMKRRLCGL